VRLKAASYQIVEGQYLRDILDQPPALERTLRGLRIAEDLKRFAVRLRESKLRRIVLTGMGASMHALYPLFLQLNEHGYTAIAAETSELVHSLQCFFDPETLIVAVSQSGQSAEIVRLLEENRGHAPIVGVTNTAGSPLASQANVSIVTEAGTEFSVSCKTYVTALMALHLLGGFFCGCEPSQTREELAQTIPAAHSYLRGWRDHIFQMAAELKAMRNFFLLGRGTSLAAAGDGSLILKESVRLHAEGMSGAAFRHGPLEMVNEETFAVVFAGPESTRPLQRRLLADIRKAGGRTACIAEDDTPGPWNLPRTPTAVQHILEIMPVQMMTLALAAEAGIEAGRFARIPKITATE